MIIFFFLIALETDSIWPVDIDMMDD